MLAQRVKIEERLDEPEGLEFVPTVTIDITGYPDERGELLAAMAEPPASDWRGEHGAYREWRGELLTMEVAMFETLPPPNAAAELIPPASDPAGDAEPAAAPDWFAEDTCLGAPGGYIGDCNLPGPHGPHPVETDPEIELAPVPELVPERDDQPTPETKKAYAEYARARAVYEFHGKTFDNEGAIRDAIAAYPGRHMLTDDDVTAVVGQLMLAGAVPPATLPHQELIRPFVIGRANMFARWRADRANRAEQPVNAGPLGGL